MKNATTADAQFKQSFGDVVAERDTLQSKCESQAREIERLTEQCKLFDAAAFKAKVEAKTLVDAAEAKIAAMESQEPYRYIGRDWRNMEFVTTAPRKGSPEAMTPLYLAPGAAPSEPAIPFKYGCKWCGKAKCADGCPGAAPKGSEG